MENGNQSISSDSEDNNIFGKGLADQIARIPNMDEDEQTDKPKPSSKYKHSYLSSIQSIRGIEKEKLNEALQNQVNKLTIINDKFQRILADDKKMHPGGKYRSADRKPLYVKPTASSVLQKPKPSMGKNLNFIKF